MLECTHAERIQPQRHNRRCEIQLIRWNSSLFRQDLQETPFDILCFTVANLCRRPIHCGNFTLCRARSGQTRGHNGQLPRQISLPAGLALHLATGGPGNPARPHQHDGPYWHFDALGQHQSNRVGNLVISRLLDLFDLLDDGKAFALRSLY